MSVQSFTSKIHLPEIHMPNWLSSNKGAAAEIPVNAAGLADPQDLLAINAALDAAPPIAPAAAAPIFNASQSIARDTLLGSLMLATAFLPPMARLATGIIAGSIGALTGLGEVREGMKTGNTQQVLDGGMHMLTGGVTTALGVIGNPVFSVWATSGGLAILAGKTFIDHPGSTLKGAAEEIGGLFADGFNAVRQETPWRNEPAAPQVPPAPAEPVFQSSKSIARDTLLGSMIVATAFMPPMARIATGLIGGIIGTAAGFGEVREGMKTGNTQQVLDGGMHMLAGGVLGSLASIGNPVFSVWATSGGLAILTGKTLMDHPGNALKGGAEQVGGLLKDAFNAVRQETPWH